MGLRLLGLVPIGFEIWGLWQLRGSDEDTRPPLASTAIKIATVAFANGADNISDSNRRHRAYCRSGHCHHLASCDYPQCPAQRQFTKICSTERFVDAAISGAAAGGDCGMGGLRLEYEAN